MPRSFSDATASRRIVPAAGGPNTVHPRTRPVPLSMLKYPANFACCGLRLLSGAEVFAHVGLRAEQPLFLAAPQRHADGAPRLDAGRHQNACRLHHDRAADCVVGRAGGRMPRIEVPAEHDHFVRFVAARNFRHDVVAGASLGMGAIDDVELELNGAAVGDEAPDAAVVLVPHHDGRRRLGHVVAGIVERADLAVVASRIVDADNGAAVDEKLVELLLQLIVVQRLIVARLFAVAAVGCCCAGCCCCCCAGPPCGAAFNWFSTSWSSRRSAAGLKLTSTCCGGLISTTFPLTDVFSESRYVVSVARVARWRQRHLHAPGRGRHRSSPGSTRAPRRRARPSPARRDARSDVRCSIRRG